MFYEANEPSSACRLWRIFMVETSTPPSKRNGTSIDLEVERVKRLGNYFVVSCLCLRSRLAILFVINSKV